MNRFYNWMLLVITGLLIVPTVAILVTWNTLPNEPLYPVKRFLERAALFVLSPSESAQANLQVVLVDRRTDEAMQILGDTDTAQMLSAIEYQAVTAQTAVVSTKNLAVKRQVASQLIAKLEVTNQKLEQKKLALQGTDNLVNPTPSPTTLPTHTIKAPSPTITPAPSPVSNLSEPVNDINGTQGEINNIIDELKQETATEPTPSAAPTPIEQPTTTPDHTFEDKKNELKDKSIHPD